MAKMKISNYKLKNSYNALARFSTDDSETNIKLVELRRSLDVAMEAIQLFEQGLLSKYTEQGLTEDEANRNPELKKELLAYMLQEVEIKVDKVEIEYAPKGYGRTYQAEDIYNTYDLISFKKRETNV